LLNVKMVVHVVTTGFEGLREDNKLKTLGSKVLSRE
jgi:hypothetical protein